MAGMVTAKGSASSVTEASPRLRRARMARRVGSASPAKVTLGGSSGMTWQTIALINELVQHRRGAAPVKAAKAQPNGRRSDSVAFILNQVVEQLDAVFHALADPTRRSMVRGLAEREQTVGELAQ